MRRKKFAGKLPIWEKMTSDLCKYEVFTHSLGYLTLNETTLRELHSARRADPLSAYFKRIEPKTNGNTDVMPVEDI